MPLSLLNHSALALFAQRTRIPTSARSIGFCAIWVCISSSSSSATINLWSSIVRFTNKSYLGVCFSQQGPQAIILQDAAPFFFITQPKYNFKKL